MGLVIFSGFMTLSGFSVRAVLAYICLHGCCYTILKKFARHLAGRKTKKIETPNEGLL